MAEWFAVHYRDASSSADEDSSQFSSLELAVNHAFFLLHEGKAEPVRIIGATGEIVGQAMLNELLSAKARVMGQRRRSKKKQAAFGQY